jgi:hypothetical protein
MAILSLQLLDHFHQAVPLLPKIRYFLNVATWVGAGFELGDKSSSP